MLDLVLVLYIVNCVVEKKLMKLSFSFFIDINYVNNNIFFLF